jgi:hypothetical protein
VWQIKIFFSCVLIIKINMDKKNDPLLYGEGGRSFTI